MVQLHCTAISMNPKLLPYQLFHIFDDTVPLISFRNFANSCDLKLIIPTPDVAQLNNLKVHTLGGGVQPNTAMAFTLVYS